MANITATLTPDKIEIIEGAPGVYPLWGKIDETVLNNEKIKNFRKEKDDEGYLILSANQLLDNEGTLYWLMFDEEFNCSLLPYGKVKEW